MHATYLAAYRHHVRLFEDLIHTFILFINIAEVTDQNFVQEDSGVKKVNTRRRKRRKSTSGICESGNDQVLCKIDL